ncbi:MAG: M48 family metallopeptidase, partial [Nanoarchaeota archaeon]
MSVYQQISINKRNSVILFLFFFVILISLGYIFGEVLQLGAYFGIFIALFFSVFSALFSYFLGDKMVLKVSGAQKITKEQNQVLYNLVESLSLGSGIPMPKLYIMNDLSINAFATGRNPKNASIAVTKGCLMKLNKEELEGVLAHEISHIKNYDIRFMVLVAVLVGTIVILSDFFLRTFMFTSSDDKKGANLILIIIGFTLAVLSPIFTELIKLAISRKREYLADASGALPTKNPGGLANALRKIGK